MTECGVQSYPNAKVIANLKIARYLKQRAYVTQVKLFCALGKGLIFTSRTCFLIVSDETFVLKYYLHSAVCRPWPTFEWQTRRF